MTMTALAAFPDDRERCPVCNSIMARSGSGCLVCPECELKPFDPQSTSGDLCVKHWMPKSVIWCESGLAYVHGDYEMICLACSLERRIAHAEKVAAELPNMKRELEELTNRNVKGSGLHGRLGNS